MKITRIRIGKPRFEKSLSEKDVYNNVGRDEALPIPPDDENNYWAEAIEDGDKFNYRVNGITVSITDDEFRMVVSNPYLYYFSTALKLHIRINQKRQSQDDLPISEPTVAPGNAST